MRERDLLGVVVSEANSIVIESLHGYLPSSQPLIGSHGATDRGWWHKALDRSCPLEVDDDEVSCAVCGESDHDESNLIVLCDNCPLAVHQMCYTGLSELPAADKPWLCEPCRLEVPPESRSCVFCPVNGVGAFCQTADGSWAHVICALWISEVGFDDPQEMSVIGSSHRVAPGRLRQRCCICHRSSGACILCAAEGCRSVFHVPCGQRRNLLVQAQGEWPFLGFCEAHVKEYESGSVVVREGGR